MRLGCGGLLIAGGLFLLIGVLAGDSLQEQSLMTNLVMSVLFILAPIAGGGLMIRNHFKRKHFSLKAKEADLYQRRERHILRLAQEHKGRLSIPEIAVSSSMTTNEAETIMEELARKGYADIQVTDSGAIIYEFYGMADRESLEER